MNYDDLECPRCKTTKYRNPQLKLLVNSCGHPLCENCIELMFATGTAKCYQCPVPLKRGNFKRQLFQDSQVEKDIQVRRDILRKFNKNQDAFPSLRAYNDYLEKLETVIYNLANNIDIDETNKLLDELRRPTATIKESISESKHKVKELPYYHKLETVNNEGPKLPPFDERYLKAIRSFTPREVAGGFNAHIAIERALSDAFTCLFSRHIKKIESH
uniref:CDK-activating kinase assembly factor MAT1 n=1 Tax=Aceria tosichella TaxID=561515 RepID=A0A6G1SKG2_9ACAR